jgi:hypothetical protein
LFVYRISTPFSFPGPVWSGRSGGERSLNSICRSSPPSTRGSEWRIRL